MDNSPLIQIMQLDLLSEIRYYCPPKYNFEGFDKIVSR